MEFLKLIIAFKLLIILASQRSWAKHVYYDFTVRYMCGSPDGVRVCHILSVNGQFPGPTIRAEIHDTLHVTVHNKIQRGFGETGTSIHWHGILQRGSPFQDGAEMVTQCPIPRLRSQTYVFKLEQAGTYWWHSHVGYQYSEGMWGALIIDNKPELYANDYDDEIIITLSDWYHTSGATNNNWYLSPASKGNVPIPFSILLNGRGTFPCNATRLPCSNHQPTKVIHVTRGKRYRIRIINTSTATEFLFYMPKHNLTVIEVDGVDTVQRSAQPISSIRSGQRISVIAEMNAEGDEHWFVAESVLDPYNYDEPNINPNPRAMNPFVTAKLVYGCGDPDTPTPPGLLVLHPHAGKVLNLFRFESTLSPADGILAPAKFDQQIILNVGTVIDGEGVTRTTFNNITYRKGRTPLLYYVLRNMRVPTYGNPYFTKFNQVVQIVVNNRDKNYHPLHLHGHTVWVLGTGSGTTNDYTPSRDKLILNGERRDIVTVPKQSWLVIRFISDNPGAWTLHCHLNWHLQGGLAATIIEAPEVARKELSIPFKAKQFCKS